jgi:hypothetical protein
MPRIDAWVVCPDSCDDAGRANDPMVNATMPDRATPTKRR